MKKRLPSFIAGMLSAALVCALTVSALAANGLLSIEVDPGVNIKVNGEVFKPKNEQGEDVMVFNYGGTIYAPVRALAKAYGLEVVYDQASKMATVGEAAESTPAPGTTTPPADYSDWSAEEEAAYQEFKGMWEVKSYTANDHTPVATYSGDLDRTAFINMWNENAKITYELFCCRMVVELNPNKENKQGCLMWFYYGSEYLTESAVYANGKTHCFINFII